MVESKLDEKLLAFDVEAHNSFTFLRNKLKKTFGVSKHYFYKSIFWDDNRTTISNSSYRIIIFPEFWGSMNGNPQ